MTNAELGWAAGVIEGEGTVAAMDGGYSNPRISVGTTDVDVVARLLEILGAGNVYGPFDYNKNKLSDGERKPLWFWKVYSKNAIAVGMTIWSLMGERRKAKLTEMIQAWRVARKGPRPKVK